MWRIRIIFIRIRIQDVKKLLWTRIQDPDLNGNGKSFDLDILYLQEDGHSDWVSCVRFSPNNHNPIIVSAGWDKYVKVWKLTNCKLKTNHIGHTGYLNTVTMSPDGSLCTSGGKDAKAMLWDLNDGKHLYTLDHADTINSLCFSPNRYTTRSPLF